MAAFELIPGIGVAPMGTRPPEGTNVNAPSVLSARQHASPEAPDKSVAPVPVLPRSAPVVISVGLNTSRDVVKAARARRKQLTGEVRTQRKQLRESERQLAEITRLLNAARATKPSATIKSLRRSA